MKRFGQHSKVTARPGKRDELVAKFLEVGEIQRSNPECELIFVSTTENDANAVYLTEVWSSEENHEQALDSEEVRAWAGAMPELVDGEPQSQRFEPVGGKGLVARRPS
jgi:quinol monooxygenase YgiN